jgi:hypothetical protein
MVSSTGVQHEETKWTGGGGDENATLPRKKDLSPSLIYKENRPETRVILATGCDGLPEKIRADAL